MGQRNSSSKRPAIIGITCRTHVVPPKEEGRESSNRATQRTASQSSTGFLGKKVCIDCVVQAGGTPVLVPSVEDNGFIEEMLRTLDGVLVAGGDDAHPSLYGQEPHEKLGPVDEIKGRFEAALVRGALDAGLPLFGICGGLQMLNVVCGGTLYQDIASCAPPAMRQHPIVDDMRPCHDVEIVPGSRLHAILGETKLRVNSTHHQAVDALGDGLAVTARATDGVIEAIERPGEPFVLAVQFHPETLAPHDPIFQRPFDTFIDACTKT